MSFRASQEAAFKRASELAEGFREKGKKLYESGQYQSAYDHYTQSLECAPFGWKFDCHVRGNRAAALMMLERYLECIQDCHRVEGSDAASMQRVVGRRGRAHLKLGELAEAEECFKMEIERASMAGSPGTSSEKQEKVRRELHDEATAGLKQVQRARGLEAALRRIDPPLKRFLLQADELLEYCPKWRQAHVCKATVLVMLKRFSEAKKFIETATLDNHESLLKMHAHTGTQLSANIPAPRVSNLAWSCVVDASAGPGKTRLHCNEHAVVQGMLFMGPTLAKLYLDCLKNVESSRSNCTDVMAAYVRIVVGLKLTGWGFVPNVLAQAQRLSAAKKEGDACYAAKQWERAAKKYTEALRADREACLWNAVILSNRAAAHMSRSKFHDAVDDCDAALQRDAGLMKAHVRRARAYQEMGGVENLNKAISDFRKYLDQIPAPVDFLKVEKELSSTKMQKHNLEKVQERSRNNRNYGYGTWDSDEDDDHYDDDDDDDDYANFKDFIFGADGRSARAGMSAAPGGYRQPPRGAGWRGSKAGAGAGYGNGFSQGRSQPPGGIPGGGMPGSGRGPGHSSSWNSSHGGAGRSSSQRVPVPKKPQGPNHYATLGVSLTASAKEVKTAYRKMALKFHPDKNKAPDAEDMLKKGTEAYDILSDVAKRREYDMTRYR
jgi:tetratricopeptide (TPR) repeat protein